LKGRFDEVTWGVAALFIIRIILHILASSIWKSLKNQSSGDLLNIPQFEGHDNPK
jgi:hypothetical protein